jgi:hypothetical protein
MVNIFKWVIHAWHSKVKTIVLFQKTMSSQVLISGRIQLSNCLFSLEPDFDILTINL